MLNDTEMKYDTVNLVIFIFTFLQHTINLCLQSVKAFY